MSGWIKIGAQFITALAHQWKGSSHPNLPSETTNSMAAEELAPGVCSGAVPPGNQISNQPETSPDKEKIERRRQIVPHFFNDFLDVHRRQTEDIRGAPKSGRRPHQRTTGCARRAMAA